MSKTTPIASLLDCRIAILEHKLDSLKRQRAEEAGGSEQPAEETHDQDRDGWPILKRTFPMFDGGGMLIVTAGKHDFIFHEAFGIPAGETEGRHLWHREVKIASVDDFEPEFGARDSLRITSEQDWREITVSYRVRPGAEILIERVY